MSTASTGRTDGPSYEPPRVERVLSPEELAREVQYAGFEITTDILEN